VAFQRTPRLISVSRYRSMAYVCTAPGKGHPHLLHPTTMANVLVPGDPRDRVISITVAVVSMVVGVLPLAGFVVGVVRIFLYDKPAMPPVLVLFQVFALGLIGLSVTIFRALRHGDVIHWLRGEPPLNYLLLILVLILGAFLKAEVTLIEHIMVRWGARPRVADLLMLLPLIAGGLVFAVYWRRASAARVRQ
jgi:hypothetical protein